MYHLCIDDIESLLMMVDMMAINSDLHINWSHTVLAEVQDSLYLMPGALYIGNEVNEIKTLLGSCVAVTLWHPLDHIVAMTHIVLPSSQGKKGPRYASNAIPELTRVVKSHGYKPLEFETGLFGGGYMFNSGETGGVDIGDQNVKASRELLTQAGFQLNQLDVLGTVYRHITIDRLTGLVELKSTEVASTMG